MSRTHEAVRAGGELGELPHGRDSTEIPAGVELPDGRVLTFAPSRECPCRDCRAAFALFDAGMLFRPPSLDDLPW